MTVRTDGLEGIIAGSSAICYIDGLGGKLRYRGIDIAALAEQATFEEVACLLWHDELPNRAQLDDLIARLSTERAIPAPVLQVLQMLPRTTNAMDALRTGVSLLASYDPDTPDMSLGAGQRKAVRLLAKIPTVVATWARLSAGKDPVEPVPGPVATAFLHGLNGAAPHPAAARALDVVLILQADHELNASTFASRVIAATLSDMHSAVVGGIGALRGPLHGGANQGVMQMLLDIGTPENAERWVLDKLAKHDRIMGFGHRVYKTADPRATVLREMARRLSQEAGHAEWFQMSQTVEAVMMREKKLNSNVDFFSATVYASLGIPVDLFTPIFALSRTSGWTAHILEQYRDNRLIRPRAEYVGHAERAYVPIERRG
ncbi:MAG: citrate synthase [Actinobacteria bacterium]|nr:citrate synthase [Actinomycetota bacterium]